ncbi:hypothetical protein TWF696_008410 [Orbilia brochopaga]|uniref:Pinin/SDK/MemA protein domain-containing protein n=1 Tax=Orbilia brochopaga TaxID=3140254 RepID=A0AAV9UGL4_9PEZI
MSADAPIIASAVVIPPNATPPSPPHRKRRESTDLTSANDDPEAPSSKRTRLAPASIQDEKSRSQRLFGTILGNLGRVSQDTRTRKRQEVDAKMQEKLRAQQAAERAGMRRNREVKEEGKRAFANHAAQVRRRNESHMANFLSTRARPKIYYRPWKLLRSQELLIEQQKEIAARNRSPSPNTAPRRHSEVQQDRDSIPIYHSSDDDKRDQPLDDKEDTAMKDDTTTREGDTSRHEYDDDDTKSNEGGGSKAREPSPIPLVQPGDEEEEMVEY